jgi:hypothetical protein
MGIESALDALHAWAAASRGFRLLTAVTRALLAVGFFSAGKVKVLGEPFTSLPRETAIGYFFDAMHRTGGYYRFIGAGQLLAALLLLAPATATLGALVYFPIILNIFIITVALHFQGTPLITGLMLLACFYLLCWDYPRFKSVLFERPAPLPAKPPVSWPLTLTVALGTQGAVGTLGGIAAGRLALWDLALLVIAAGVPLVRWALRRRTTQPT